MDIFVVLVLILLVGGFCLAKMNKTPRSFFVFLLGLLMVGSSFALLFAASQPGLNVGFTMDGQRIDLSWLMIGAALVQIVIWSYVSVFACVSFWFGEDITDNLRSRTEQSMSRAADALRDLILDVGWDDANRVDAEKPESSMEPLPPLSSGDFIAGMRGKTEQTLARVAEVINLAHTGEEIAATEEYVNAILRELRFDALAMGLQMRQDAKAATIQPAGPAARLSTKSGKAKSYAASEHWRPVWAERFRSMRASDTAIRLAQHSRHRANLDN